MALDAVRTSAFGVTINSEDSEAGCAPVSRAVRLAFAASSSDVPTYSSLVREVPTPVWIIDRGLTGPTYLITRIPAQSALALPGLLFAALAIVLLLGGRLDMVIGVLVIGILVTAVTALFMSRFRFLATETWVAAEYAFANRLVRLDEVVQASVSSGSYTWLKLRDARGGRISIQVGVTLPRIRSQVARGVASGHLRGMALDSRVARTLGLTITSQLDR